MLDLLEKIRKLNWMLSESATGYVSFEELSDMIGDLIESNVYVMNKRGKVLAAKYQDGEQAPIVKDASGRYILPKEYNDKFIEMRNTKSNLIYDSIKNIYGDDYEMADKYHTIVPIIFGGKRVATLLVARGGKAYSDEDVAICEYGATVIGLEVTREITMEEEADSRERNTVNMALETLSYSELEAVTKIFAELEGNEGLLVASKIADKSGITRSVIVNALRKLESAGVIESRSLGMKGTRIKITNEFLRDEINNINM